VIIGPL
jgi:hypothetical protein